VCRAFEDPDVTHVEDRIDPVADLDIIHAELRAKDVERLDSELIWVGFVWAQKKRDKKGGGLDTPPPPSRSHAPKKKTRKNPPPKTGIIADFAKSRTSLKKDQQEELECAKKVRAWCCGEAEGGSASEGGAAGDGEKGTPAGGRDVRLGDWGTREVEILNGWQLLTAKPVVYLVNVSEKDYARKKNKFLPKIFEWVQVGWVVLGFELRSRQAGAALAPAPLRLARPPTTPPQKPTSAQPPKPLKNPKPTTGPRRRPHHPLQRRL
jgi:obg-like ATPase 1